MNLFACDIDPRVAARALCDQHVVKMVLETAQLLSTALELLDAYPDGAYRPTHRHHPVTHWLAGDGVHAYDDAHALRFWWTIEHGLALADEYHYRFDKDHKSRRVLLLCAAAVADVLPTAPNPLDATFAFCGPDDLADLADTDVPAAYRATLRRKYASWHRCPDRRAARYTRRAPPTWAADVCEVRPLPTT